MFGDPLGCVIRLLTDYVMLVLVVRRNQSRVMIRAMCRLSSLPIGIAERRMQLLRPSSAGE